MEENDLANTEQMQEVPASPASELPPEPETMDRERLEPAPGHTITIRNLNAYYGNILLVALMLGWDLYRGRLIRSYVIASMTLVACMFFNSILFFWKPWSDLTLRWVTAWAK